MFEIIIADSPKSCRPKISSSKVLYFTKYSQSTQTTIWPAGASSSAIISLKLLCFTLHIPTPQMGTLHLSHLLLKLHQNQNVHSQPKKYTTFVEVFDSLDVLKGGVFFKIGPFVLQVQHLTLLLSLCFLGVNMYIAASFVLIKI